MIHPSESFAGTSWRFLSASSCLTGYHSVGIFQTTFGDCTSERPLPLLAIDDALSAAVVDQDKSCEAGEHDPLHGQTPPNDLPLCVDVKIHYALLKYLYEQSYSP